MIFSDEYKKAIFEVVKKNRWDIYSARYPSLIVPGSMEGCLVKKSPELALNIPYVLHPNRNVFRGSKNMTSKDLDQKVLNMSNSIKPFVKFYLDIDEFKGFVPSDNYVEVDLVSHPRFKLDKRPSKSHKESVSYMHFVEALERMGSLPYDKFQ
jgi:hypothetical protein